MNKHVILAFLLFALMTVSLAASIGTGYQVKHKLTYLLIFKYNLTNFSI